MSPLSDSADAAQVSLIRLYAMRAVYLMMALFLISTAWPQVVQPAPTLMTGVARALLSALGLLALLGLRYPLQMLPILLFEFAWKAIWTFAIGLPLWSAGRLDPDSYETLKACALGVVLVPAVLPWRYLIDHYVKRPGDRWR